MDTLLSIKVFQKVVDTGSFATAAKRMDLSAAMVSKHVMHLESHLATRLLNRTTRKLSLTESGRAYYERCSVALNDLEEAEQAINEASTTPRGTLRVNSLLSFSVRHVAPVISRYTAKYPQVTVDLTLNDRIVDLVEDGYDLAIRGAVSGEIRPSTLIARPIAKVQFVVCAAPSYLTRHGTPRTPPDLSRHNCLVYAYGPNTREWTLGAAGSQIRVPVSGNLIVNNVDALLAASLAGSGVAFLPTDIAGDDLAAGRLVPLLLQIEPADVEIFAVYPSRRHLSAKVRTFVDFLAETFARKPFWTGKTDAARGKTRAGKR